MSPEPKRDGGAWQRPLRMFANVLIVAGALVLIDSVLTITWQEPVTAFVTKLRQDELSDDFVRLRAAGPTQVEAAALASMETDTRRIAFLARSLRKRTKRGQALGRVRMPSIGVDKVVVKGTGTAELRKGPGFYDQTSLPGVRGTVGIAGHRTTYGAPFRRIDKLRKGHRIIVEMPYASFTYTVERSRIVKPSAIEVIKRVSYDRLVLSACHPLFSAAKRIVVFARLTGVRPAAAARRRGSRRASSGHRSR